MFFTWNFIQQSPTPSISMPNSRCEPKRSIFDEDDNENVIHQKNINQHHDMKNVEGHKNVQHLKQG